MQLPSKLVIGSAGALVFGILFGWVAFPMILKSQIVKQMALHPGTETRDMWEKIPFPLDFKVYLFNCTNHMEVMKGAKPRVKEIGPYHYEEWKEKLNLEDLEDEDAIYYNRRDTFIFDPAKSDGLTGEEIIIMPHIIIMSTAARVAVERPAMLNLVNKAMATIYGNPESVFVAAKAREILFDGFRIDCTSTDFAAKAVCTAMAKEPTLDPAGDGYLKFSFFGQKNATIEEARFKVLRGIKNIKDVGRVVEYKGEISQTVWRGKACNDYEGTDSTIFPPFLTPKDDLLSFTPDICRSLGAKFLRKSVYAGIQTNRYIADVGDLSHCAGTRCFCEESACPPAGLMDIRRCVRAPLIVSMPHLLNVAPEVQKSVLGMHPDIEKHGIFVDFEPLSGTPMQARKRLQFNIPLDPVDKLDLFKNLTGTLVPLFWVEEGLALNKTFVSMMKAQLFRPMRAVAVLKWLLVTGGMLGGAAAAFLHYRRRIMDFAVRPAPVPPTTPAPPPTQVLDLHKKRY